jgi:uncharacterized protein (TIGR02147 family)
MTDIYAYTDYRIFLKDHIAEKQSKTGAFSYRQISQKAGIRSSGFFSWVLQGKRNISERLINELIRILKLDQYEADYFTIMVHYNQANTVIERKRFFDELVTFRKKAYKTIIPEQFEFYKHWYYSALRELVAITSVNDDNNIQIAKLFSPPLNHSQVKHGLEDLSKLGMIRKSRDGSYERTDDVVSTGAKTEAVAIQTYQIACMELAKTAYDRFPQQKREMSTITMSIDEQGMAAIIDKLRKVREDIIEIARATAKPTMVLHCNMQLFPLSTELREQ